MTRNEIDDLMRDNGIVVVGEAVYALCQLVAAAERERYTKGFAVQFGSAKAWEDWCKSIRENEREACAQVCDDLSDNYEKMDKWGSYKTAEALSQAIRARGQA